MSRLEQRDTWAEILRHRDDLTLAELARRFGGTPGQIVAALQRTGFVRGAVGADDDADDLPPELGEAPRVTAAPSRARPSRPAPAPAAPVTPSAGAMAWQVRLRASDGSVVGGVVLASDLASAAAAAVGLGLGEPELVALVGEVRA